MNRVTARCLLLIFPSLFGVQSWAQEPAPLVKEARARTATTSPHVALVPKRLFGAIPISTHSDEARKFVELAIDKYESGLLDDAIVHARHATEKDPQFALAYAFLSFAGRHGTPDATALTRAKSFLSRATPDEQLLVRWMTSVEEGDLLPAIMTMNDLLKRYPADKHVLYLTSEWLYFQQDYGRARQLMETTLRVDPNFAPTFNLLGYAYLETGNPDPAKAMAALRRYAELQPGQPNPEKSLAEILRYAGDDQGSVEHYGAALQLDPTFIAARVGLSDTLTLMSDYPNALDQYDRAISMAEASRDRLHAEYQKALVFFWEGDLAEGRKRLEGLAEKARAEKEPYAQFEIDFARALLATNGVDEFAQLKSLESFLQGPVAGMTEADRNASLGAVWRERARAYASSGKSDAADQAVHQLQELAAHTRDLVIENTYESAHGYALFAQGDVANAADELATDLRNPLVLRQFILAQEKLGNSAGAEASRIRLKYLRASTIEWFLVAGSGSSKAH
jgi:tetratricopeptide (TPR) repeat protein